MPSPVVPLGVLCVAGAVRSRHTVEVFDLCFAEDPHAALAQAIKRFAPDVVGLGLRNLHDNTYASEEPLLAYFEGLGGVVRETTAAPLVLGGAAVTLRPLALLERIGANHAIIGEGEHAFLALVDKIERSQPAERIMHAGTAELPRVRDLDELPEPARDLVDPRYFALDATDAVQTKRGCAFECTYCDYPDLEGSKVRLRSPARVADDIVARAQTPGVEFVFVVDSVFNVPRSHALAVCKELEQRGAPVPWVCYASPASLDDDVVAAMARAGCVGAEIGLDAGTPRMLSRLRKPFTIEQARRVRESLRRHGIADCQTLVLGAEDETVDEALETLAFVDELDPDVAVFVVFREDRERLKVGRARHRQQLIELLSREAPKRPRWSVPELGIRFDPKINEVFRRRGLRGPSWLHLARRR